MHPNDSLPFSFFLFTFTLDRPRSSIGQSVGLRSRRLQVRLLSGIVSGAAEIASSCTALAEVRHFLHLPPRLPASNVMEQALPVPAEQDVQPSINHEAQIE